MSCTLAPLSKEAKGEFGNDEPCPAVTSKLTSKILIKREISADSEEAFGWMSAYLCPGFVR